MNAIINAEPFSSWYQEAAPLFLAHWREVGVHRDVMKLDVDVERIIRLEQIGLWRSWTVRRAGALYGYCCVLIAPHLHYRTHNVAYVDVVYLDPVIRGGRIGKHLLSTVVDACKGKATKIVVHAKLDHDFGPLLAHLGFGATETNYERLL